MPDGDNPWEREAFQRKMVIERGFKDFSSERARNEKAKTNPGYHRSLMYESKNGRVDWGSINA